MNRVRHRLFTRHGQRGSALVISLLILLALSALGMTAMQSVSSTIWQSGLYRSDTQAQLFSEAAMNYASQLTGNNAATYLNILKHQATLNQEEVDDIRLGAFQLFMSPGAYIGDISASDPIVLDYPADVDGLFSNDDNPFFDDGFVPASFVYILRDPMDGPSVPGYSQDFCFKKVTIASLSRVGEMDPELGRRHVIGRGINMLEAYIGPVECGSF